MRVYRVRGIQKKKEKSVYQIPIAFLVFIEADPAAVLNWAW
jgi:hypothetical protein